MLDLYQRRSSRCWKDRIYRALEPPQPFVRNPHETFDAPLGKWNLYIGGAGAVVPGYVNIDLFAQPGVDVVTDAEALPFPDNTFQRVECDAVLEHVRRPERVMSEIQRTLRPGGVVHVVVPFCHPFHAFPADYRRFTIEGVEEIAGALQVVAAGWRTGPTATLLVFVLEYAKMWSSARLWRTVVHGILGWLFFPLRYLDHLLWKSPRAGRLGNHCYVWLQKPERAAVTAPEPLSGN